MLIRFASLTLLLAVLGLAGCASNKPAISDAQMFDENGQPILAPLPEGFEDKYRNGLSLLEGGDFEKAVDHWRTLTESHPEYAGVWTNYGLALSHQDDPNSSENALAAYENAQAVSPDYCPVNSLKGIVLRDLGRFDEAQNSYERAIQCNPKDGRNYYNLGILFDLYRNDLGSALEYYRKARRLMPDEEVLNIWVVDLARRNGEAEEDPESLDAWEQSLAPAPEPAPTESFVSTELVEGVAVESGNQGESQGNTSEEADADTQEVGVSESDIQTQQTQEPDRETLRQQDMELKDPRLNESETDNPESAVQAREQIPTEAAGQ